MKKETNKKDDIFPSRHCALCRRVLLDEGNNGFPIVMNPRCAVCDNCNFERVIPARLHRCHLAMEDLTKKINDICGSFIKRTGSK